MRHGDFPDIADILENEECWTEEVYLQVRERCHELSIENPTEYLSLARHVPELAKRVAPKTDEPARLHLDACVALGDAYRLSGLFDDAETMFAKAAEYGRDLSRLDKLPLERHLASLRKDQSLFDESLSLINGVIQTYRLQGDLLNRTGLGLSYLVRAITLYKKGDIDLSILDLTTALNLVDLKKHPRIYYSILHNITVALVECNSADVLGKGLKLLRTARSSVPFRGRHLAKFKLRWLEGLIHNRFGSTRVGEQRLLVARDGLIELGAAYDVALVSLDLVKLYLLEGESSAVVLNLAEETYNLFQDMSCDQEANAVLLLWCQAAEKEELTEEVLESLRNRLLGLTKLPITKQ